ncbi:Protein of unknown function (DUF3307) [Xenococcus sp. PCC 7305]|uniref:DUF3307 domain-containing protein n=1 Tax=Xenococcus sp. PCC 7305 TaxID=102125 RepID=UPI0002AB9E14|nr:DUF3307 domain-containing protein [Xenococcus sp. PCC 7305]ELS01177.1 Protein of unknown function (DUF3307) [Xenococcus sp. PCC 7305]
MIQIIFHLVGDYVFQSDWMAQNKTKSSAIAMLHAISYSLLFCFLVNWIGLLQIIFTHYLIDRFRLARYVVFTKNFLAPRSKWVNWDESSQYGYSKKVPDYIAFWLLIITDNTLHLACNYFAIYYFGGNLAGN